MTAKDTITLPREVARLAFSYIEWYIENEGGGRFAQVREAAEVLRTALADEPTKQEPGLMEGLTELARQMKPLDADMAAILNANLDSLYIEDEPALAAEQPVPTDKDSLTHPGYVIGSHWLETAYSRICAGEAEADVLRDCGWERVDQALRRDAERYRYLRSRDPKEVLNKSGKAAGVWIDWEDDLSVLQLLTGDDADAAIDAAMKERT